MAIIIDRTEETGASLESRRRFFNKVSYKARHAIMEGSDTKTKGLKHGGIKLDADINEPKLRFDYSGSDVVHEAVVIANRAYNKNDEVITYTDPLQQLLNDLDSDDSNDGESSHSDGVDDFVFYLNEKEFCNLMFEGLELPNFIEKDSFKIDKKTWKHNGYIKYGIPSNLSIKRSFTEAFARRIAIKGALDNELHQTCTDLAKEQLSLNPDENEIERLKLEARELQERKTKIPFIDDVDLRYHTRVPVLRKTTDAAVFLCLDVSGSMTETMKDRAKRFFYFVTLFLKTQYENVKIVFLTHTDTVLEVSEEEFFSSIRSGSTEFLPLYKQVNEIIDARFPPNSYNIYMIHASDSDYLDEKKSISSFLHENLFSKLQFSIYTHVAQSYGSSDIDRSRSISEAMVRMKSIFNIIDKNHVVALFDEYSPFRALYDIFRKRR